VWDEAPLADEKLPPAVSGERFDTQGGAGRVACYVAGSGPPMLLVHSVNAAASAAEVRPLHEHYRASRTVYSIDLPGFGASERSDRVYSPRLMTDALLQLLEAMPAQSTRSPYPPAASSWRGRRRSFRNGSAGWHSLARRACAETRRAVVRLARRERCRGCTVRCGVQAGEARCIAD
jgi:hypothetical protein